MIPAQTNKKISFQLSHPLLPPQAYWGSELLEMVPAMSVYSAKLGAERFSAVAWSIRPYMRSLMGRSVFLAWREGGCSRERRGQCHARPQGALGKFPFALSSLPSQKLEQVPIPHRSRTMMLGHWGKRSRLGKPRATGSAQMHA